MIYNIGIANFGKVTNGQEEISFPIVFTEESWDFVKDFIQIPEGVYQTVEYPHHQFKVRHWAYEGLVNRLEICLPSKHSEDHPIEILANSEMEAKGINDEDDHREEHEEYECSRCRGGGCPSCDKSGFFTGIKIYD